MRNQEPKKKKNQFFVIVLSLGFRIVFFYCFVLIPRVHLVAILRMILKGFHVFSSFFSSSSYFMFVNLFDYYCFNWTLDSDDDYVCAEHNRLYERPTNEQLVSK